MFRLVVLSALAAISLQQCPDGKPSGPALMGFCPTGQSLVDGKWCCDTPAPVPVAVASSETCDTSSVIGPALLGCPSGSFEDANGDCCANKIY